VIRFIKYILEANDTGQVQ